MVKGKIPAEVKSVAEKLNKNGFEAFLVGGCVRDLLISPPAGGEPKDWDIATNAKPEQIQKIFSTFAKATADKPATVYENDFGTVGVKTESENPKLKVLEVTTYRLEGKYSDKRHPDEIKFAKTIEEDLSRRDFTINALAMSLKDEIIDPYGGQKDLRAKIIRTVGDPEERFDEDALRLMRAVRFAVELDFSIEDKTKAAIKKQAKLLGVIAKERIRDELVKIIMSDKSKFGIELLEELGLLQYIIPELREGIDVGQNKHHIYSVWEHNLRALDYAAKNNYSLEVRLASLLHDVGKPKTKRGNGSESTFHGHEVVGARMVKKIMEDLRFSKAVSDKVVHLVRFHLFYYNVGEVTEAGVRRFLARVGPENVDDFIKVREADRIGSGVPKAVPYKIRHLLFMIDKVKRDPISPKMLKVSGDDVMKITGLEPSPKVGQILAILLEEVLDDPQRNEVEILRLRIQELNKLPEKKLIEMMKKAKEKKEEFESEEVEDIKKKHWVK